MSRHYLPASAAALEASDIAERCEIELPKPGERWVPPSCYLGDGESQRPVADLPSGKCIETKYSFFELPLGHRSLEGVAAFKSMTKIQFLTLPHALNGRDVIAEAATGGGKTLCFVVPILERMWRDHWDRDDGCFALILTPTRELALQIFEVFSTFQEHSNISVMTVFGGKFLVEEQKRISRIGVVIGTPGRVLAHIEESFTFNTDNLKMVVLDEADKLIEMGFLETTERILTSLPAKEERQNLFFSATLKGAARTLARKFCRPDNCERLMQNFEGVVDPAGRDSALGETMTPVGLLHSYIQLPSMADKVNTLYTLLCDNFRKKIIVFCSTIKQVRFLWEAFTELKTGARIKEIHGKQDQLMRMHVFEEFSRRQAAITIISTDLLARGVDFPAVDLVIQFDCPPDVDTYIHRAGRTARGVGKSGESVIILNASEEKFVARCAEKGLVLHPHNNQKRRHALNNITPNLRAMCAKREDVKHLATKCFLSTYKAYSILKDKQVFNLDALLSQRLLFATSLGLVSAPPLPAEVMSKSRLESTGASATACAGSDEDACLDGGVVKSLDDKRLKNRSKLERLKERIEAKRASAAVATSSNPNGVSKQAFTPCLEDDDDEQGEGTAHLSRRARRRQRMQELREMSSEGLAAAVTQTVSSSDALQVAKQQVIENLEVVDKKNWRENEAVRRALKKQRLVIRADGTAKIKGASKHIEIEHKFYASDDEEGVDFGTFEGAVKMLQAAAGEDEIIETRDQRLERLCNKLNEAKRAAKQEKQASRKRRATSREEELAEVDTDVDEEELEEKLAAEFSL